MRRLISFIAIFIATSLMSVIISAQSLNDNAFLNGECSSSFLFSQDKEDNGTNSPIINVSAISGYKFSDNLSVGLGFGFNFEAKSDYKTIIGFSKNKTSTVSVPLFIYGRYNILPLSTIHPFVYGKVGYRSTLVRTKDAQKEDFYTLREYGITDMIYSRYYGSGSFGEIVAGISINDRFDIGIGYGIYSRKHTVMKIDSGNQIYNTSTKGINGISIKIGLNF